MVAVFEELAIPSRRAILGELRTGPKNVGQLVQSTGLKQPNVSNHLAKLRDRGLVRAQRIGREVIYALATPEIEESVRLAFSPRESFIEEVDLERMAREYAKLSIQGDEPSCAELIDTAIRHATPLLDIYEGLLSPGMVQVGDWYHRGIIDEGQEHLATAITERMMSRVMTAQIPAGRVQKVALLGASANNWHSVGVRMVSDYLRHAGWTVYYMGANVPEPAFLAAVDNHDPDLTLVSVSEAAVEEGESLVRALRAKYPDRQIGVGGRAPGNDPHRFERAGASFVVSSLRQFAELANRFALERS